MAEDGRIEIRGGAALDRELRGFPDRLQKQILRPALRKGIVVIEAEVKQATPFRLGWLFSSISSKVRTIQGQLVAGVYFGPRGFVWRFVERGTKQRFTKAARAFRNRPTRKKKYRPGANRGRMPKRPFIGPAFERAAPAALAAIAKATAQGIARWRKRLTGVVS